MQLTVGRLRNLVAHLPDDTLVGICIEDPISGDVFYAYEEEDQQSYLVEHGEQSLMLVMKLEQGSTEAE